MGKRIDPELLGQVFARISGREHVMSGELPHGNTFNTGCVWGDSSIINNPHSPPPPYYLRSYTWEKVKIGDLMIFWSRQNKGQIVLIQNVYSNYTSHWLDYEGRLLQPPRKGDKYSILREEI